LIIAIALAAGSARGASPAPPVISIAQRNGFR